MLKCVKLLLSISNHLFLLYPATDAVNNEVPLPTHYRSGCIQTPAGVCCYRRGQKYPPMPVCAEEIKLLYFWSMFSSAAEQDLLESNTMSPNTLEIRDFLAIVNQAGRHMGRATLFVCVLQPFPAPDICPMFPLPPAPPHHTVFE